MQATSFEPEKEIVADGPRKPWKDGDVVTAADGVSYRLTETMRTEHGRRVNARHQYGATFVRTDGKVRGKAAAKRDKKARRQWRERVAHHREALARGVGESGVRG